MTFAYADFVFMDNLSAGSGPVYMGNYGSPDMVYGGGSYPVQYPMHQVCASL